MGWYNCPFKSLSAGGMRIWNGSFANEQSLKNAKKIYQMYALKKNQIYDLVSDANK